ncbi:MAG: trigger factor [Clostridia bacterium]
MATFEKLENNRVKLTVSVSPETFAVATQQAYLKGVKHYNVPGFRKGKAPRKVIENLYGAEVFFEDAFEIVWGDAYDAALDEHKLIAVDKPSLDIETISLQDGVVFTAEVQLQPEVTLGAYRGIEVAEPTYTVEDQEVMAEIEKEREKNARFVDVDRAVENDDRVMLDYSGSVNGEKFDGGTAEDQMLVIGSNTFIPGFEEQVIGMKTGESKDITVTFPAEYAEPLAGKEAVFAITIKAVQFKELPTLDDEFAKDISEFDTLDALIADKKKTMSEQAEANRKTAIENLAIKTACDNATVDIPDVMIERQVNYMLQDIAYRLKASGLSMEDYCKFTGTDLTALKESYREEAAARVKMQLVIEAVGKAESITCTDEDLQKSIAEYAGKNSQEPEAFEKNLSEDDREYLSDRVVAEKTVEFIVENAKLVKEKKTKDDAEKAEKPKK